MPNRITVDDQGTRRHFNEKGQLHREDGPAIERVGGSTSWYLEGVFLTEEQWKKRVAELLS